MRAAQVEQHAIYPATGTMRMEVICGECSHPLNDSFLIDPLHPLTRPRKRASHLLPVNPQIISPAGAPESSPVYEHSLQRHTHSHTRVLKVFGWLDWATITIAARFGVLQVLVQGKEKT
jgi:hypothetical protein